MKYIVLNENTLCYYEDKQTNLVGVLSGKPQLGGYNWINGSVYIGGLDIVRSATLEDFKFFRVSPIGHIA